VENQLEEEKDTKVLSYLESLENCKKQTSSLLDHTNSLLSDLKVLDENYHFVSEKTNSLHESCQQLIEEQVGVEGNIFNAVELFYLICLCLEKLCISILFVQSQKKLDGISREVDTNLSQFLMLERIASKLSSSDLLVTSDAFFQILEQIDSCLSFMIHNVRQQTSSNSHHFASFRSYLIQVFFLTA